MRIWEEWTNSSVVCPRAVRYLTSTQTLLSSSEGSGSDDCGGNGDVDPIEGEGDSEADTDPSGLDSTGDSKADGEAEAAEPDDGGTIGTAGSKTSDGDGAADDSGVVGSSGSSEV